MLHRSKRNLDLLHLKALITIVNIIHSSKVDSLATIVFYLVFDFPVKCLFSSIIVVFFSFCLSVFNGLISNTYYTNFCNQFKADHIVYFLVRTTNPLHINYTIYVFIYIKGLFVSYFYLLVSRNLIFHHFFSIFSLLFLLYVQKLEIYLLYIFNF